jgi:2-hydroxychromene-2-carboxylate isomerase
MRVVMGVQMKLPQQFNDVLVAVFKAMWIDDLNLNEPALTSRTLESTGLTLAQVEGLIGDPEVKAALRANTEEAVGRGVFGAPTTFVGEEMFFGQDKLDLIKEELAS